MGKNKNKKVQEEPVKNEQAQNSNEKETVETTEETVEATVEVDETEKKIADLEKEVATLKSQIEEANKNYLLKSAEFENFRRRTLQEKAELIKNGGESAMKNLLPVIDDFERAIKALEESDDAAAVKEGVNLIYNKFIKYLNQNGVTEIECGAGSEFNTDLHEAVTMFPAPTEELKGKVVDAVQKGYMINDKVLRHTKVVVGE